MEHLPITSFLYGHEEIRSCTAGEHDLPDTLDNSFDAEAYLARSRDARSLFRRTGLALAKLGLPAYSFMLLRNGIDARDGMGTFPMELREVYEERALYRQDWLVEHALYSNKPVFLSDLESSAENAAFENSTFAANRSIFALYHHFGIQEFYAIPFESHSKIGRVLFCVSCVGADTDQVQQLVLEHVTLLGALARALDRVGSEKFSSAFPTRRLREAPVIGRASLRLLEYLATHDASLNDAAEALHISISTANQHIAAAKKSLEVHNSIAAVLRALQLQLIRL